MKKYRVIAIVLAAMMIIAMFAGCSNDSAKTDDSSSSTSSSSSASSSSSSSSSTSDESKEAPDAAKEERTTIKYSSMEQYQTEPCDWLDTEIWQWIQEEANVDIQYNYIDGDKMNLMLASGDLGDIIWSGSISDKLGDIIETKLAYDLLPLIDEKIPSLLNENYTGALELYVEAGDGVGLYFLPEYLGVELPEGAPYVGRGYNVRWDWYKEIGAPAINNDEDYVAALKAMVANHPTNEDGEKVYGIGLADSLFNWSNHASFTTAMTDPWTFGGYMFQESVRDTSVLIDGYRDTENSAFWRSMEFYNAMWNEGLLDPDSFTQTSDEYTTKQRAGRYAATANWAEGNLYDEMRQKDPETLAGIIAIPSEGQYWFAHKLNPYGNFPIDLIFVAANTKNIDAVCRLVNVVYNIDTQRMFYMGIEGDTWNYVDGVPTFTDEYTEMVSSGDQRLQEIGIGVFGGFMAVQGTDYHTDGYRIQANSADVDELAKTLNPLQKDMAAHYGVTLPSEASKKLYEEGKMINLAELVGGPATAMPTDDKRILENCNDILYAHIYDLVKAATAEDFAAIQADVLKELEDANIEEAWDYALNEFNKTYELVYPILQERLAAEAAVAGK